MIIILITLEGGILFPFLDIKHKEHKGLFFFALLRARAMKIFSYLPG